MCPSYLDGDQALLPAASGRAKHPVIPVWAAIVAIAARWHGCAVFKVREEAPSRQSGPPTTGPAGSRPVSQNSTACTRGHEGCGCQARSTFRYRVELGRDGMPRTAFAGAPILELP
jgi:hypothetical protein